MAIFDNPLDAVKTGWEFARQSTQDFQKQKAYNALERIYGPTAGDPVTAGQLQTNAHNAQMDPLLVNQQQLTNTSLEQSNALAKTRAPEIARSDVITNDTNQNALDQTQRVQKAQQTHQALSASLATLGAQLQNVEDPNQRLQLFDAQVDQIAPLIGADPNQLKHQLAQQRAAIATQGADAIPAIQQQMDAALSAGLSPEDRVKLQIAGTNADIAQTKLEQEQTKATNLAKNGGLTPALQMKQEAQKRADSASLDTFANTVSDIAGDGGAIDAAITFIAQHPDSYGFVAKGVLGHGAADVSGTNAYNLAQLLAPITSNVVLDKLSELKKTSSTGASGLGQLSDKEGEYLKTSAGSVDQGQSMPQLIANLRKLKANMIRSRERLSSAYTKAYGEDSSAAAAAPPVDGTAPPADGTPPVDGTAPPAAPAAPPTSYAGDPSLWQYLTPEEQALWQQ